MSVQSEAALENGLIATLQKMNYEYVHIEEEKNLSANFKKQLEKHNKKKLEELGRTEFTESEFEKILIYLEGGTRFEKAKKLRDLFPLELENGERLWVEFLNRTDYTYQWSAFGSNRTEAQRCGTETGIQPDTTLSQDFFPWTV